MPPPLPLIRDVVVRRILRLLDGGYSAQARLAFAQWRLCYDFQWPGGGNMERRRDTTLIDVSPYVRVHTLGLYNCPGVTDVSSLCAVHTLLLCECPGVTDVSALGAVHTLILFNCSGVTDVSSLGAVHTLLLWFCPGVTDVSSLTAVHMLKLYHCPGVPPAQIATLRTHGVNVDLY